MSYIGNEVLRERLRNMAEDERLYNYALKELICPKCGEMLEAYHNPSFTRYTCAGCGFEVERNKR